ncbi:D-inositol-3-phosphate glycosyltransferase [Candidatus Methanoperedenaceae archaeon GB50]|nr:D-inositol-3-phosphate glycosyltransferase [Candidatus Methanoperedenaceae archaeon GB37]CAD7769582.1 D-inositol-3-phosphate glycosyltransferase [Candidatus Methanoperedenaceae archaeon GB50]CAD7778526.1 MAG: D-inositol-3-phosphate glycosyltransferase [Candidatus Methanoperedenaceae archaeon GB50]
MKVLIVNTKMDIYGGAELLIVKLANYLSREGIENALLTTFLSPEIEKDLNGTETLSLNKVFGRGVVLINTTREILMLQRHVQNFKDSFDVINVHNFPAEVSVFGADKPTVWMCNEPPIFWLDQKLSLPLQIPHRLLLSFEKLVVRKYVKHVCVSDKFNAERFERIYGFKPAIINYGIDYGFFFEGNMKEAMEKFDLYDSFVVLHVGMLTPLKNQMGSIKTVEKLKDRIPNIKLVLAGLGEGDYRVMLENYIKEKNLEQNVVFTGHLNRESVKDLYHACDVLLHPIKSQGGWLAPFEALCAKKPIIVSREMTASDIIRREGIGIVTDDFAEAILDIYNNPGKYYEIAERGQAWVKGNLNWDNFCEKMVDVFYRAIGVKRT